MNTHLDTNLRSDNNGEMESEFDNCIDDKVCVYETVISGGFIYEEPCDMDNEHGSAHNFVSIKDETLDDLTVTAQESELINGCREDKVCVNELLSSGGYIQQEPCNMEPEQKNRWNYADIKEENLGNLTVIAQETELVTNCAGNKSCKKKCINKSISGGGETKPKPCNTKDNQQNVHNYVNIKEEDIDDPIIVAQQTKFMTDCTDDKVCINETVISGGCIKPELCDTQDESGSICSYINIKDENTNDYMFIVVQETELTANPKANYFICCEECDEEYDLYCLKCPMLFRIFDSDNQDGKDNTDRWTLPKKFIDICETPSGVGIVALRTIPKGVVFGPFKGLVSTKDDAVSKWKLRNKKLAYAKDPEWLNWMQYIRSVDQNSHQNLIPFQYEDGLYYRSDCLISVGDELLVCWDSDGIQDVEHGYRESPVCESLDDSYTCSLCCVGYKSINHLIAHNCVCSEKRNGKDFCKEIVQCDICKIYLDKKEYTDCHMDLCFNSNKKCAFRTHYKSSDGRPLGYHVDIQQINCESDDIGFGNTRLIARHKEVHALGDKTGSCCKYEYQTGFQYAFSKHLVKVYEGTKLKRYNAHHNDDRPFARTVCLYKATINWSLKQHIVTHKNDRPFACTLCSYKATTNSKLKRHVAIHNGDKSFACTLCAFRTTDNSTLKRHIAIHNGDKPFACTFCPYKATTNSNLKRHVAIHNGHKPFVCTLCAYRTTDNSSLTQHIAIHNGDKPFACSLCSYKATTKRMLKQHIDVHNDDRPLECTLCPYKAKRKTDLRQHIAIHNGNKPFACTFCPYKAKTSSNLNQHIVIHKDDRAFACNLCLYKSSTKSKLKKHIVIHNGDKPYACTLCPYKTKTNAILKLHIAIHNGDKPFACSLCPYKATTNWKLKQHTAIHNEDRPFACTLCPRKATTKSSLKRHIANHNTERPFACTLCSYKATTSSNLKQHIVTHKGDRPFACSLCLYKSSRKSNLKKHIAIHNVVEDLACAKV